MCYKKRARDHGPGDEWYTTGGAVTLHTRASSAQCPFPFRLFASQNNCMSHLQINEGALTISVNSQIHKLLETTAASMQIAANARQLLAPYVRALVLISVFTFIIPVLASTCFCCRICTFAGGPWTILDNQAVTIYVFQEQARCIGAPAGGFVNR